MFRSIVMAAACLLIAAPALGAGQKDHDDCNSDDPGRVVAGCTRIVDDAGESNKVRAIAHGRRGLVLQDQGKHDAGSRNTPAPSISTRMMRWPTTTARWSGGRSGISTRRSPT